jgi:hypothetical protein
LPELSDTICISRFPIWLRHLYRPAKVLLRLAARMFPEAAIPMGIYLDKSRVSDNPIFWDALRNDSYYLKSYPLCFVSSLVTSRFPSLTNGEMRCSVYAIIDAGDKLFPEPYMRKVIGLLRAPYKEIIVFNFNDHVFMITHPQEVCETLSAKLGEALRAAPHSG